MRPEEHRRPPIIFSLVVLAFAGCRCEDRFECGIRAGQEVTRCSGSDELCLCSVHRCVVVDPSCDHDYAYVFPELEDERCVEERDLGQTISNEATGSGALCPDERAVPLTCGTKISGNVATCLDDSVCLCDRKICASYRVSADCLTGWRPATDPDSCLSLEGLDPDFRAGSDGLCPDTAIPAAQITCGKPDDRTRMVQDCGGEDRCICENSRCAFSDPASCPQSNLRYRSGAPDLVECVPLELLAETVDTGLCPDFRPPRVACGVEGGQSIDCPLETQRCVCSTGFCAEPADAQQCSTMLRYAGSGECVPEDQTSPTGSIIEDGLCAPPCGAVDGTGRVVNCPFGECICGPDGGRCAVQDATCRSGRAYAGDDRCVVYGEDTWARPIAAGAVCPERLEETPCGVPARDGRVARCATGERCACSSEGGTCVREEASCPSGLAHVPSQRCAVADPVLIDQGLCPGVVTATAVRCGVIDASGRVLSCAAGESCTCRSEGGLCVRTEPACPSGQEQVHDDRCLEFSETDHALTASSPSRVCPRDAPEPIACGEDVAAECGAGAACLCGEGGGCVSSSDACASGLVFTAINRCAVPEPAQELAETGACSTSTKADAP